MLTARGRTRHDDSIAVRFEEHPKDVLKGRIILDDEDDVHRIGHADIVTDQTLARPPVRVAVLPRPGEAARLEPSANTYTFRPYVVRSIDRRLRKMTIKLLCIDDEPEYAELIAEEFDERGFDVSLARDGVEGIEAMLRLEPDIVL